MQRPSDKLILIVLSVLLAAAVLAAFWPVLGNSFINYDDDKYVTKNQNVLAGISIAGVKWAFTTFEAGNWHPLTWISLMFDAQFYKSKPLGYHLSNLLLHLLSTLLLFYLLNRITRSVWRSALVAALFALHPLRVESIAWAAERKDVLSTLLWMLTLWSYVWYAKKPDVKRYLLVALAFALGLLAKPMLVTLPAILLLLDYWPLGRFSTIKLKDLLVEKIPLFLMVVGSCIVTVIAQHAGGALRTMEQYPFGIRAANALIACADYIIKMFYPHNLAVYYPHPGASITWQQTTGAAFLFIAITVLAILTRKKKPYLITGWLWYIITLLPVIGLVQVGTQAMADRYTYIPLIGLSIMLIWGIADILPTAKAISIIIRAGAVGAIVALVILTHIQTGYWHNSFTLFQHALNVTRSNPVAHNNLGFALYEKGDLDGARRQFEEALKIDPNYFDSRVSMGAVLLRENHIPEAIANLNIALKQTDNDADLQNDLGIYYGMQGDIKKAIGHFSKALKIDPNNESAKQDLQKAKGMLKEK
jgi:protein O-mannosyl-transferase